MRDYRAKLRADRQPSAVPLPDWPDDPAQALADWSAGNLKVPPGHAAAGRPLVLPPFAVDFFRDSLRPGIRESLLSVGRKNAKSAAVAVYILGRLCGPLRTAGYRAGVCSVSREKASELWQQIVDIAEASNLEGLTFRKAPRSVIGPDGRCEILSADRSAGHASGFDDAICDEIGLFSERDRELVNGLVSSVSARDGRFMALSVFGDAPFTRELYERREDPAVCVHLWQSPDGCALDDESAWRAANPTLGSVKSERYMADMARRAIATPSDAASFRAFDLNQPQSPSRVMLCQPDQWLRCEVDTLPDRGGPCFLGFDLGGSTSMTAAVAYWPRTERLEAWAGFPSIPSLADRSVSDGCRGVYQEMERRGELRVYPGEVMPVSDFLGDVAVSLTGERVMAGADRFRGAEARDALKGAGVDWPMSWRGTGASKTADGSYDVRALQRLVIGQRVKARQSLAMRAAIADSSLRYDGAGNPALEKARAAGRIDLLSAAVIAAGLAELHGAKPARRWRYAGAA